MVIAEFLKGLPSHDPKNFSLYNTEHGPRTSQKRPSVYLPTDDIPTEQRIVMDKRCVLLRYLTQQWDKKSLPKKRDHATSEGSVSGLSANANSNSTPSGCKKRSRLDFVDIN
ncbi:DET1- and DDB1-associated protein 1 [Teleopsis dalmanni]|uniref:DET1- and DDB1-associated protein 1 n=1 Tax=Teleopsis dalmanni TaxID=139649 RepID=UPI0018CD68C7|nr:DET1- and DDB1-associated protein 1 [Teleopsis dalmanni]